MLGHISIGIRDLERQRRFYDAVMAPFGFVRVWSDASGIGYGPPGGGDKLALFVHADSAPPGRGFHIAFDAPSRAAVDAFYRAALANGGRDDGPPGLRPQYTPTYYAAFVFDPEGWKLEAVHQQH
jgi:catechol 2,3-dioxygenase-like lactoylglutathione lyase family enzyme